MIHKICWRSGFRAEKYDSRGSFQSSPDQEHAYLFRSTMCLVTHFAPVLCHFAQFFSTGPTGFFHHCPIGPNSGKIVVDSAH